MKNVNITTTGTIMTITVDLAKSFGPSASGKTIIVASTNGNKFQDGVYVGLNVYSKGTANQSGPAPSVGPAIIPAKVVSF